MFFLILLAKITFQSFVSRTVSDIRDFDDILKNHNVDVSVTEKLPVVGGTVQKLYYDMFYTFSEDYECFQHS